MSTHKRLAPHRDTTFRRPVYECYACHDTGLLANSDGLLRQLLPDYDCTPDGLPSAGYDLAVVCWCKAAYDERGPDGQLVRGGYRNDSGDVRQINTNSGLQAVGASLSKEQTRQLHRSRLEQWLATEETMTAARQAGEAPWFIAEAKALIQSLPSASEATERSGGGLQSLGAILGAGDQSHAA